MSCATSATARYLANSATNLATPSSSRQGRDRLESLVAAFIAGTYKNLKNAAWRLATDAGIESVSTARSWLDACEKDDGPTPGGEPLAILSARNVELRDQITALCDEITREIQARDAAGLPPLLIPARRTTRRI
jgi:hypothetical protein